MKVEVNMTRVGEPTQNMWELIWKIEKALGITYDGPEDFKAAGRWIDDHMFEFVMANDNDTNWVDDWGYEYYEPRY